MLSLLEGAFPQLQRPQLHALLDQDYLQRYFTHYHSDSAGVELTAQQERVLRFMKDHVRVIREDY